MSYNKFMEGNNAPFKRIVTANLISQLITKNTNLFNNSYKFAELSTEFQQALEELNDYKRKMFKINDYIEFTNISTLEIMFVKITNLYHFKNFEDQMTSRYFLTNISLSVAEELLYEYVLEKTGTSLLSLQLERLAMAVRTGKADTNWHIAPNVRVKLTQKNVTIERVD